MGVIHRNTERKCALVIKNIVQLGRMFLPENALFWYASVLTRHIVIEHFLLGTLANSARMCEGSYRDE